MREIRIARALAASLRVARTLYHGTTVDNEESIRQLGLVGGVGSFVEEAYDEWVGAGVKIPDLVFASDKQGLERSVTAMVHHISKKLGKNFHSVTDNDIINHGLLVIIHDEENEVEQRPEGDENYRGQYPPQVEPGDYFSEELWVDKLVKGRQLLRLLERYNQWPRSWGPQDLTRMKKMRGWLITLFLQIKRDKSKQEIMALVQGLSDTKVEQTYSFYKGRGY
jgi:hypothetical protein